MFTYTLGLGGRSRDTATIEYYQVGSHAAAVLDQILAWSGRRWEALDAMLDFAAGYGRVTRFLCTRMPAEKVWIGEILAPAVQFQHQTFGVHALLSQTDPDTVKLPRQYDLISVVSLFTHLPEATFSRWLSKLAHALAPGGILVITCHGPELFQRSFGRPLKGNFFFEADSESAVLDHNSYGRTYLHASYVEAQVKKLGDVQLLAHVPFGLNGEHDVFVIGKGVRQPTQPCVLRPNPIGFIDGCDEWRVGGWALDGAEHRPAKRVQVMLDDRVLGDAELGYERPDLAEKFGGADSLRGGWLISFDRPAKLPNWVAAVAEDEHGLRGFQVRALSDMLKG